MWGGQLRLESLCIWVNTVYSCRCAYCIYPNIRQEFFSFPVYPLKNQEVVLLLHTSLSMLWSGIFRKIEGCNRSSSCRRLIMRVDKYYVAGLVYTVGCDDLHQF